MGFRIVRPDVAVLQLSGGKTITVRRRLTTGEERTVLKRGRAADGSYDSLEYIFGRVVAYLLDWSVPPTDEPPPAISGVDEATLVSILNKLDPDDYIEIKNAIDAHIMAMVQERLDEKKTAPATSSAEPISPLPSEPVGQLIGSAT